MILPMQRDQFKEEKKNIEQEEIDKIVEKHLKEKQKNRIKVTYDENGNRYIHVDGEWIG